MILFLSFCQWIVILPISKVILDLLLKSILYAIIPVMNRFEIPNNWKEKCKKFLFAGMSVAGIAMSGSVREGNIKDSYKPKLLNESVKIEQNYKQQANRTLEPNERLNTNPNSTKTSDYYREIIYHETFIQSRNFPAFNSLEMVIKKNPQLEFGSKSHIEAAIQQRARLNNSSVAGAIAEIQFTTRAFNEQQLSNPRQSLLGSYMKAVESHVKFLESAQKNKTVAEKISKDATYIASLAEVIRSTVIQDEQSFVGEIIAKQNQVIIDFLIGIGSLGAAVLTFKYTLDKNAQREIKIQEFQELRNQGEQFVPKGIYLSERTEYIKIINSVKRLFDNTDINNKQNQYDGIEEYVSEKITDPQSKDYLLRLIALARKV
jgi:hypothetical protein